MILNTLYQNPLFKNVEKNLLVTYNNLFHTNHFALYQACLKNDFELVRKYLYNGADPDFLQDGFNSLYWAVKHKNKIILKKLFEFDADPNVFYEMPKKQKNDESSQKTHYQSLFYLACQSEEYGILKAVLKTKIDINFYFSSSSVNNDYFLLTTPMDWLEKIAQGSNKHFKLMRLLLNYNFDFIQYQKHLTQHLNQEYHIFKKITALYEYHNYFEIMEKLQNDLQKHQLEKKIKDGKVLDIGKSKKNVKIL